MAAAAVSVAVAVAAPVAVAVAVAVAVVATPPVMLLALEEAVVDRCSSMRPPTA